MAVMSSGGDAAADLVARVGRHWGWLLFFGIVNVLVGVLVLIWPGKTIVVIAVLFGIELIVEGIFQFVAAFAAGESGGMRVLYAILGVLSFVIGLYALRHIYVTVAALALLLGIYWIVYGVMELFGGLSGRGMSGRGWTIAMGILGIIAGIIVLMYPGISLVTLAVVLGIWLIILGIMWIFAAFQLRSVGATAARIATA